MNPINDYMNEICVELFKEKRLKVLLVVDSVEFLNSLKERSEQEDTFQIDTCSSVDEAFARLKNTEYDAVAADYQIDDKNGLEILKKLQLESKDVPFILFLSKSSEEITIEDLNMGVDQYIDKHKDSETTFKEFEHSVCRAVRMRRTAKHLKETENRLQLIMNNVQDVLLLADNNFICTFVSSSVKNVLGYEPNELIGKLVYDFVHPDDLSLILGDNTKSINFSEGQKFEFRCRRADGSYALVEGNGKFLPDETGTLANVVLTARDITERTRIELSLNASEEKYRSLFENMLNGFTYCKMIWDNNGKPADFIYLEVNDAFEKLTGLKKADVLGKKVTEAIPGIKETTPELFEIYGRVSSSGKEESFEIYLKPLEIWLSVSAYSIKKDYFAAIFENVTERKKRIEKMRFQAGLLDAVGQAVIATDNDRLITYWNSAAEKLHGWSEKEMKGQAISRIIPEDMAREYMPQIVANLGAKKSWEGEVTTTCADGAVIPVMITISPIINSQGERVGAIMVETDITEQKWMQQVTNEAVAKIAELNEKLQVVESLTRHDIRNKMSALNGRIYLLKKHLAENPEASTHVKELDLLSNQILRILEFERIYVQVGAEELEYVNVAESVDEAVTLLSNAIGVQVVNDCAGLEVLADSLLRQLFYNLMDNSLKYGEKLSKIRIHHEEQENQLKLIYEDDGVGIPETVKANLFKKGFGKGTGYGLYLIRRICEAYGWTIEETGKQGEGVRFVMSIPKLHKNRKESYKSY